MAGVRKNSTNQVTDHSESSLLQNAGNGNYAWQMLYSAYNGLNNVAKNVVVDELGIGAKTLIFRMFAGDPK